MAKENKYSAENIRVLTWPEAVRLRPGMYVGEMNINGFMNLTTLFLSEIIKSQNPEKIKIKIKEDLKCEILIEGIKEEINQNLFIFKMHQRINFSKMTLTALSHYFNLYLFVGNKLIYQQNFIEGINQNSGIKEKPLFVEQIKFEFQLNNILWKDLKELNPIFISDKIREFSYFNKSVKFYLNYKIEEEENKILYHFKNGLADRLEIENLKLFGEPYFVNYLEKELEGFSLELAFSFNSYAVNENSIISYVNDYKTIEHGSHVDGLLNGLTHGVMKYFQSQGFTDEYKISEKGIREDLVAIISVRMNAAVFSGCTKNKLANPEIIKPIVEFIKESFFEAIQKDKEATKRLVRKFEVKDF